MGNYNINNALLANPREALACLLNTFYINITWAIRNGPKYLKDLNVAETFQQLSIYTTFLINIKNGL